MLRSVFASLSVVVVVGSLIVGCLADSAGSDGPKQRSVAGDRVAELDARAAHLDQVRRSDFCAKCHPEATAEHRQNTHGRAFSDPEVRLATARFSTDGCIACHTPRPVFETGVGMNPIKQLHHLEEGNDCLSCHAKGGYDFSTFAGGDDCKRAFDARVGTVEACASCHRNHGTPYQWENAAFGATAGNKCVDCHMPEVERPVAVGMPARKTRRHTFFGGRSPSQLAMAHEYDAKIVGNEAVVRVTNAGAGHNFPTELKQRSVESLVVIRDVTGREVARSRAVYRDPYKRPYGLVLPVNTQIPSGESREHRVPLPIATGTIETTLFYKLYFPIEDNDPEMSRVLQRRSLAFGPIEPSKKAIETAPEIHAALPEAIPAKAASPGNLADFAHPVIGKVAIEIPDGTKPGDIEVLVSRFQYPALEANRRAQDVLFGLGAKAVPALIEALGSWDNKTWTQAQNVLIRLANAKESEKSEPAKKALVAALSHAALYVRFHAREILPRCGGALPGATEALVAGLRSEQPLDRASSAETLGKIGAKEAIAAIRPLVDELDFDNVACAARALGILGDRESIPALRHALVRWKKSVETTRDVAWGLAALGDPSGIPTLLDGLDHSDDLVRESIFESFLDVTGASFAYTPFLPFEERTAALAELRTRWAEKGGASALRRPRSLGVAAPQRAAIAKLVRDIGGNDVTPGTPEETEKAVQQLIAMGAVVVPQVVEGLKWPPGFADKRAGLLRVLASVPDTDALPALLDAVRDPVLAVALWAGQGLGVLGDKHAREALRRLDQRFEAQAATGRLPAGIGIPEETRVVIANARLRVGDAEGARSLLRLLFSLEVTARAKAEEVLRGHFGEAQPNELGIAKEVRSVLASLPQAYAAEVASMREIWEKHIDEAEAAAPNAKTPTEIRDALTKYDLAEEAVTRYARLDPRAFEQDFRRTTLGADDLAQRLYEGGAYANALASRDLLALTERAGVAANRGFNVAFESEQVVLEAPADLADGGSLSFGLGGPGGFTVAMEWMRDYQLSFEVEVVRQGYRILDRFDPIWLISQMTGALAVAPGTPGALAVPVAEGKRYEVVHSVLGGDVIHRQREIAANANGAARGNEWDEYISNAASRVRKGGVVFMLDPGAKVILRNLRLKVLRYDAAEAVNAMVATPGR